MIPEVSFASSAKAKRRKLKSVHPKVKEVIASIVDQIEIDLSYSEWEEPLTVSKVDLGTLDSPAGHASGGTDRAGKIPRTLLNPRSSMP